MISTLFQLYFVTFLSVGAIALFLLVFGLIWIFKPNHRQINHLNLVWRSADQQDLSSISGDNIYSTQLDLARAYIETNHVHLAKQILDTVLKHGSKPQQQEAQKLLTNCRA